MSDTGHTEAAELLIDSYGESSSLVRLATLASPACRIEPQLLRRLRLGCVPDADASVEQELWHSELVNSRGTTITFRAAIVQVLRERLRDWRSRDRTIVMSARDIMNEVHADLPPLLVLEDKLAWAAIFDEDADIQNGARDLLNSLLAGREGLEHWLGRAWEGLPGKLKESPEGKDLAQVAAANGAPIEESNQQAGTSVAHMLPLAPLPLRLHGARLDVNVSPQEATHAIDVPQTLPRALEVSWHGGKKQLVFGVADSRSVHLPVGVNVLRTLAGTEYELKVEGKVTDFEVEMFPAGVGTTLIVRYGDVHDSGRIIVDCGDRRTAARLGERLGEGKPGDIELLVLTHVDDDRIGGAKSFLEQHSMRFRDIWFNGSQQLNLNDEAL